MRNVSKLAPPSLLIRNKESWDRAIAERNNDYNRTRYRDAQIKQLLLEETKGKCVYCESKVGHNCPGDIEHKIPTSIRLDLIFDWDNMTIACNECNRRKLNYYDPDWMFLDPNIDDVESRIQHLGPLVFNQPGDKRSEITVRILEVDKIDARRALIARKIEKLEQTKNLIERIVLERNQIIRNFMLSELQESCSIAAEFSGMTRAYVTDLQRILPIAIVQLSD